MAKQYRIQIRGKQREQIDADLMARLVVMLGRQLAEDARQAVEAAADADRDQADPERPAAGGAAGWRSYSSSPSLARAPLGSSPPRGGGGGWCGAAPLGA